MPTTRIRTRDLLSGSVASGSLAAGSITGLVAATTVQDSDLVLIYDDDTSGLRKMTRANFTAGLSTTLSGAYDAGRFITASNGAVDIQVSSNTNAPTELLRLVVSGSVSGTDSGPRLSFQVPYNDTAYIGAAIDGIKSQTSSNNSTAELQFSTSDNNQTLVHNVTINTSGLAVAGSSATVPTLGSGPHALMVAASGDSGALNVRNSSGYVGVGLTNPLVPLHVYRSDTNVTPQISAQQGSTGDAGFFLSIPAVSYMLGIDNSDSDKFKIAYGSTATNATLGTNPRFVIDTNGRVGINKFDPEALLDMKDTDISADDGFDAPENYHLFIEGSSTNNKYMGIGIGSTNDVGGAILFQDKGGFSRGELVFMVKESSSNATAPIERLRIKADGATVLSASQFKITSAASASLFIEADTNNTTEADTAFIKLSQDDTAVQALIGFCPDNGEDPEGNAYAHATSNGLLVGATKDFNLHLGTSDTVAMTISGSASASNKGNVFLISTKDDTTSSSTNMFIDSGTGFLKRSTSDRRQKKAISSITSSLDQVCQLLPRYFYDVSDENNQTQIPGFVADEVQSVFPELIPERDDPSEIYRSVSYDRMSAYIVNAIKEIKQRLEALENGD